MLSYNQIIKANNDFADSHYIIQTFENGEIWQSESHNQQETFKYPLFFLEDQSHTSSDGIWTYSFRAWFLTKVPTLKEKENQELLRTNFNEAKSNMIQCAQDCISYWVQQTAYEFLTIDKSVGITPVVNHGDDLTTGCYFDLKLREPFTYDNCIIPLSSTPTAADKDVDITVNSTAFTSVTCGEDYNVVVKDTDGTLVGSKVGSEWIVPAASGGSFTYDLYFDGVDTGQNVTVDGTNITINLT